MNNKRFHILTSSGTKSSKCIIVDAFRQWQATKHLRRFTSTITFKIEIKERKSNFPTSILDLADVFRSANFISVASSSCFNGLEISIEGDVLHFSVYCSFVITAVFSLQTALFTTFRKIKSNKQTEQPYQYTQSFVVALCPLDRLSKTRLIVNV